MIEHANKLLLAKRIASTLGDLVGVDAVVLGGSLATGTAHVDSDIDIGIYYNKQFDPDALVKAAIILDDGNRNVTITPPGAWGQWINGGGWLVVEGVPVDILLRNTAQVKKTIQQCCNGVITIDYQCGHPFGFVNTIYMGEIAYCKPLHCNNNALSRLKSLVADCPDRYRDGAIKKFLWEAEFSLLCGRKSIALRDTVYAAGSLFRCVICLTQVVYAFNCMYILNEKGCIQRLAQADGVSLPLGFVDDMSQVMTMLSPENIKPCFELIQHQLELMHKLCGGAI